jgi:N-acetylglutamate synthase
LPTQPDSVARYRAAFAERNLVAELEALVARAWPPLTILDLDGWQLRSAGGLTWRANSAWPRAAGGRLSLSERLRQAEAFYRQGSTDPAVQLGPTTQPPGLERALLDRGYRVSGVVEMRTRRADVLAELEDGADVELVPVTSWLPAWQRATGASDHHATMAARMLERAVPPAAYAVLAEGSEVAVARGVVDGGWLGIDLLAGAGGLRTAAAGRSLVAALGRWAERFGVERAHAELTDTSAPLLAEAGFRRAYALRFLTLPRALVPRASDGGAP